MVFGGHGAGRRGVIAGAASLLALPALPRRARAEAEFTLKMGYSTPVDNTLHKRMSEAAQAIRTESNGRIDLQLFPAGQLGGDNDVLAQSRSGAVDFCVPSGQVLSSILPVAATNALGFVWSGYEQIWPAMDGDLGAFLRGQITAKTGLTPMTRMWDLGFRQVTTSNRPVKTAQDLVGLKLRVPVAPSLIALFTALQAAPVGMQFGEVYSALQTRVVDGEENPLSLVLASKFQEVQKFVSVTNHVWDGYWICCNTRIWKGLPAEIQEVLARNLDAGAVKVRADVAQLDKDAQVQLAKEGLAVNETTPDSFRERLRTAGFYKDWRGKVGDDAWRLLEKHTGPL